MTQLTLENREVAPSAQLLGRKAVSHQGRIDVDATPCAPAAKQLVESPGREPISSATSENRSIRALLRHGVLLHRPGCLGRNRHIALLPALIHDPGDAPFKAQILEVDTAELAGAHARFEHEQEERLVSFGLASGPDRG